MKMIRSNWELLLGSMIGLLAALAVITAVENKIDAQVTTTASQTLGDAWAASLNVRPNGNATNVATFWDSTGTNGFQISPTLATVAVVISNQVLTAPVATNIIITNSVGGAGSVRTMKFRNGILIGVD